ncbi:MAG: DivIVA domain-containing protein [Oscillospiraceae bacterium]|jgi:cell division initiation protein|nr:DivIVA domain-containing protein [Oscillospiraceae bacterium]
MLTPAEISGKEFEKAIFSGYHTGGVDDFLEVVTADYTALYKENGILKNKLKVLVEKIEEYRATEDAMRMALLTAQKTGEEIIAKKTREGEEYSERMERDAEARRREIDGLIADERARLLAASNETVKYVEATKALLQVHLDFLSKLDNIKRAPDPEPEPPTREDVIQEAAREIGDAVEKLYAPEPASEPDEIKYTLDDEGEPTKTFNPMLIDTEEEDRDAERTKHVFDDLKDHFGFNMEQSD